jgi:Protein of unknown function (DUF1822)
MTNSWIEAIASEPFDVSEWEYLSIDHIELSTEQVEAAQQLAQSSQENRWTVYLQMLARLAVQQWLTDRAPDLSVHASLPQPLSAAVLSDVSRLTVGEFQIRIITAGNFLDTTLSLPVACLDLPNGRSHFYVTVEVIEEQQQARITGFCNDAQLLQYQQSTPLYPTADRTYALPQSWFDSDANTLLLQLRCLEPSAISLTSDISNPAHQAESVSLPFQPRAINVATWIQNQLDDLAQGMEWLLLPASSGMMPALRGQEKLEQIRVKPWKHWRSVFLRSAWRKPRVAMGSRSAAALCDGLGIARLRMGDVDRGQF